MSCQCPLQSGINKGEPCPRQAIDGSRYCGKHQSCGQRIEQQRQHPQLPDLGQLTDLPLLNILGQMSASERQKLVDSLGNNNLFRLQREIDGGPDRRILKKLGLSGYNINYDNLMEHLHHLNGYESYDPTGVTVTIKNEGGRYSMRWNKGENSVLYSGDGRSEYASWYASTGMPRIFTDFRKGGPCHIERFNGKTRGCKWDGVNFNMPRGTACPKDMEHTSPIIDWMGAAKLLPVTSLKAMAKPIARPMAMADQDDL